MRCVCAHPAIHRFDLAANLPDDLEMFLGEHNLSVCAAASCVRLARVSRALPRSSPRLLSERTCPAAATSWVAWRC